MRRVSYPDGGQGLSAAHSSETLVTEWPAKDSSLPSAAKMRRPACPKTIPSPGTWKATSLPVMIIWPVLRSMWTGAGPFETSVCQALEIVCASAPWMLCRLGVPLLSY
jgi:hypothetical protein